MMLRVALLALFVLAGCSTQAPPQDPSGHASGIPPAYRLSYPPTGPTLAVPPLPEVQSQPKPDQAFARSIEAGATWLRPGLKVLYATKPKMPREAIVNKIEGAVTLEITFDTLGVVRRVLVVSSASDVLSEAAVSAVKQWKIQPYIDSAGRPNEVIARQTFNFKVTE